jgi:hypothetical protein
MIGLSPSTAWLRKRTLFRTARYPWTNSLRTSALFGESHPKPVRNISSLAVLREAIIQP